MREERDNRKEPTRESGGSLCNDLPDVNFSSDRTRIEKKEGEKGLQAFTRWIKEQADGWCASGICSKGRCRGHIKDIRVQLLGETPEYIEASFSTTIYCKCEKG